jgi:hypothetical protein
MELFTDFHYLHITGIYPIADQGILDVSDPRTF